MLHYLSSISSLKLKCFVLTNNLGTYTTQNLKIRDYEEFICSIFLLWGTAKPNLKTAEVFLKFFIASLAIVKIYLPAFSLSIIEIYTFGLLSLETK